MKKKRTKTKKRYIIVDTLHGDIKLLRGKDNVKGYLSFIGRGGFESIDEFLASVSVYEVGKKLVVKATPYTSPEGYKGNTLQILG